MSHLFLLQQSHVAEVHFSGVSWGKGSLQATDGTFSAHQSLRRLRWLWQLITCTLFPCKYLRAPQQQNAAFTICLLPISKSLSHPRHLSLTLNKLYIPFHKFAFPIRAAILSLFANHTHTHSKKRTHTCTANLCSHTAACNYPPQECI